MKNRIVETFMNLVRIDSESGQEGEFHNYLMDMFSSFGLKVIEDDSMVKTQLGGNNIIATLVGDESLEPYFISCHTDTVSPGRAIQPYIEEGVIYSQTDTILGADDKAGIAVMIELARTLSQSQSKHPTIEFVLTPGEEIGLVGALAMDTTMIKATRGLVLDSDGEVGGITVSSPSLAVLDFRVSGKSAHAGLEPEKGISSIYVASEIISNLPQGRINDLTTANVGLIKGGIATNIVAEKTEFRAEIRSRSTDEFKDTIHHYIKIAEAISKHHGAHVEIDVDTKCEGYNFDETDEFVQTVSNAMQRIGIKPRFDHSGGGSDANVFNARNKEALNLSVGYKEIHTVNESISVQSLNTLLELCMEIVGGSSFEK